MRFSPLVITGCFLGIATSLGGCQDSDSVRLTVDGQWQTEHRKIEAEAAELISQRQALVTHEVARLKHVEDQVAALEQKVRRGQLRRQAGKVRARRLKEWRLRHTVGRPGSDSDFEQVSHGASFVSIGLDTSGRAGVVVSRTETKTLDRDVESDVGDPPPGDACAPDSAVTDIEIAWSNETIAGLRGHCAKLVVDADVGAKTFGVATDRTALPWTGDQDGRTENLSCGANEIVTEWFVAIGANGEPVGMAIHCGAATVPRYKPSPRARSADPTSWSLEVSPELRDKLVGLTDRVRVVPRYRDGGFAGFRLMGIRAKTELSLLGFQNGDVILEVDGIGVTVPTILDDVGARLRAGESLKVTVERRGKTRLHSYSHPTTGSP